MHACIHVHVQYVRSTCEVIIKLHVYSCERDNVLTQFQQRYVTNNQGTESTERTELELLLFVYCTLLTLQHLQK